MNIKKYEIYCYFSALGKKIVEAYSLDEAIQNVESDEKIELDEIVKLTKLCKIDQKLSHEIMEIELEEPYHVEFKNWGSE